MAKLTRYDSFQSLKADTSQTPANPRQSNALYVEMEQFIESLRNSLLEEKEKNKKSSKSSNCNEQ